MTASTDAMDKTSTPPDGPAEEKTPGWMKVLRAFQALLSIIVFGLSAYLSHGGYMPVFGLGIVTAIFALCILGYYVFFRQTIVRRFYKPTVRLILEAFMVIMYLALFAATASQRAAIGRGCDDDDDDDEDDNRGRNRNACRAFENSHGFYKRGGSSVMAALAGVGALTWVLYVISFMWATARFVHDRKKNKTAVAVTGEPKDESTHDLEQGPATHEGGLSPMAQTARGDMGQSVSPDYPVSSMTPSPQVSRASPDQQEQTMQNVAAREEPISDGVSHQPYRPQAAHIYEQTQYADGLIATGGVRDHLHAGGQRNGGAAPSYDSATAQPQVSELASDDNTMSTPAAPPAIQHPADVIELDSSQRAQNRNPQGAELP